MFNLRGFAFIVVAITAASTATAETHCPGNVASVPYRLMHQNQMIVKVSINHVGPNNFLLDTGTQITMIDPALATSLHLVEHGDAKVFSAGVSASGHFSELDLLEAGQNKVAHLKVLTYDLGSLRATGLNIEGVLGEDFLEQFDVLIDNVHQRVCLDDAGAMRSEIKGAHILLLPSASADEALPDPLIVSVRLSDGMRPVRLKLDSGANVSLLYNTSDYLTLGSLRAVFSLQGSGAAGTNRSFMVLPQQNMKIESVEVRIPVDVGR